MSQVVSVALLCLFAWVAVTHIFVLQSHRQTDGRCAVLSQRLAAIDSSIREVADEAKGVWNGTVDDVAQLMQSLSARLSADFADTAQDDLRKQSTTTQPAVDYVAQDFFSSSSEFLEILRRETPGTTGAMRFVDHKRIAAADTREEQKRLRQYMWSVYTAVYRYRRLMHRVTQWRERLQPYINAMEQRGDRMLYNYI